MAWKKKTLSQLGSELETAQDRMAAAVNREFPVGSRLDIDVCQVCWSPPDWRPLAWHHIIRRSKVRCDAKWNLILICAACHEHFHGQQIPGMPELLLAHVLWVKRQLDGRLQVKRLTALRHGRSLPEPLPLPAEFMALRARNKPMRHWREL